VMNTEILAANPGGIRQAADLLTAGRPVALPTETVYGLAANALDAAAVARIYAAKGRPSDNPLIVHVTGAEQAAELATHIPAPAADLMQAFWPGPLTIVLPKQPAIPNITTGGRPDVGLRAPAHPTFQAVLAASGLPLAAPSANRAGRPSPTTAQHVYHDLAGAIPAIVDGGPCAVGLESTVISLVGATPTLLRPGGVSLEQLQQVLGQVEVDAAVYQALALDRAPGAPGMKYQHYAPQTPLTLLVGTPAAIQSWVATTAQTNSVGVLCFDDAAELFPGLPLITYGPQDDAAAQAQRLFSALHQIDSLGVDQVYAQIATETSGVFLAVRNRLLKAAGHRVIDLNSSANLP